MKRRPFLAAAATGVVVGCLDADDAATASTPTNAGSESTDGADEPGSDETVIAGVPVERRRYDLRTLPYERRPQFFGEFRRSEPECRHSVERVQQVPNVVEAEIDGQSGHFPLRTARWLLRLLHCYRASGDEGYREKAEEMSAAFLADAVTTDEGVPYFPYRLDKGGSSASLQAPWFSGMVQGVALSAYTYFHELTGDERHRDAAARVFRSFTALARDADGPWTSTVDDGYYWIEEYPADPRTHVLNGYCIGVWGIYDYWLHTGSERVRDVLEASLTTLEDHLHLFRVPGEVSYYGLDSYYYFEEGDETYVGAFRGNEFYHGVHVVQVRKLYRLSNDPFFREMAATLDEDHPGEAGTD